MKKVLLFILGFSLVILSSGCATTTQTVGGAAYGFGTGVVKDTKDTANAIMKADEWFRENCW
ncbi:MAG: hypothetical protein K9L94_04845 [Candidatus Omnitrophica bacterium]|nr:hypothetical protein [Candidatus Omnitrophota bacterium]